MINDPFSVLGVSSGATEDEIKSAYRRLAKKYHPDLNPGDKSAEEKMREINEAYTQALQIRKGGRSSASGYSYNPSGGFQSGSSYGNPYGGFNQSNQNRQQYEYRYGTDNNQSGNPFGQYGFDPFEAFFGGTDPRRSASSFRPRSYSNPELETAAGHIAAGRYTEAERILNRIPEHSSDWHALYARAEHGLGNRISALDHARSAVRLAPGDEEYRQLLFSLEENSDRYQQRQAQSGYDFRSVLCGNPCLTCFAVNIFLNCCCGRVFWC